MRTRQRPSSQHRASPPRPAAPRPVRKIFNCIVDDSALVAGVKRSTRNGIRQWVKNGQIRLFVPLQALSALQTSPSGKHRHAEDIKETLAWLDDATSKYPNFVILQGPDENFELWAEVEKFSVPRTLFSENNHDLETDSSDLANDTETKLNLDDGDVKADISSEGTQATRSLSPASINSQRSSVSAISPPSSPVNAALNPTQNIASVNATKSGTPSANAGVPENLQYLFNYILWRVHQESDPVAALESFIFLCNDGYKVHFAKGFDIKTKRLEQLREVIGREDREFKNRQNVLERESQSANAEDPKPASTGDPDHEIVFKPKPSPPKMPAAMLGKQHATVIDPNTFGRSTSPKSSQEQVNDVPMSPRDRIHAARGSPRSGLVLPFAPRGNNTHGNGRGSYRGRSRGRGNFSSGRGGLSTSNDVPDSALPAGQIDPDSFVRPVVNNGLAGGRGARKLWVPT